MKRFIFLLLALHGCASLPKAPDLRPNADELFKELETTGDNKSAASNNEARSQVDIPAPPPHAFKFEEVGSWKMSKAETQLYAERQAENDALAKALRSSGAEAYYGFSDVLSQQAGDGAESVSRYLQIWSKGIFNWERIGKAEFIPTNDGMFQCSVRIKGKVVFDGEPDPGFEITFRSGGNELGLSRTVLKEGESVEFSALLTKPAFLQVLSVDQDQNVYLVYPNSFSKFKKVQAGQVFNFPQAGAGLALQAALTDGMTQTTEVIHVIATKAVPLFAQSDFVESEAGGYKALSVGKLQEVMSKLAKLKRSDWTMAVLPYQIVK